jgi:hypothetical protein
MAIGLTSIASLITAIGSPLAAAFAPSAQGAQTIKSLLAELEQRPDDLGYVDSIAQQIASIAASAGMPNVVTVALGLRRQIAGQVSSPSVTALVLSDANAISSQLSGYTSSIFSSLSSLSSGSTAGVTLP